MQIKTFNHSLVVFLFAATFAYAADQIPPQDNAGAEQRRFEQESKMQKSAQAYKSASAAETATEETISETTAPGKKFELKGIHVTGNATISGEEIEALAAEWINQQVDLNDLKKITSKIKSCFFSR